MSSVLVLRITLAQASLMLNLRNKTGTKLSLLDVATYIYRIRKSLLIRDNSQLLMRAYLGCNLNFL